MRTRLVLLATVTLLALALVTSAGCSGAESTNSSEQSLTAVSGTPAAPTPGDSAGSAAPTTAKTASQGSVTTADRLVVTNAQMNVRVEDLSAVVASIRTLTAQAGGQISQLTISDNSETPVAAAAATGAAATRLTGPATASLTLRVPAKNLPDVQTKVAGMGKLISQSSDESDVTQQHIDLSARLTNSRAEEVRLRALLDRAGKVSDLLSVERELSRVRGDIESMSAQLAYLENQAAMATLTVSLDQPGPVVRPSAGGWGLLGAVTSGVQAAALLVRELITAIIALSPLLLVGAIVWWLLARRARKRRAAREAAAAGQPPATQWATAAPQSPVEAGNSAIPPTDPAARS